jgi:hypothetical protein
MPRRYWSLPIPYAPCRLLICDVRELIATPTFREGVYEENGCIDTWSDKLPLGADADATIYFKISFFLFSIFCHSAYLAELLIVNHFARESTRGLCFFSALFIIIQVQP